MLIWFNGTMAMTIILPLYINAQVTIGATIVQLMWYCVNYYGLINVFRSFLL